MKSGVIGIEEKHFDNVDAYSIDYARTLQQDISIGLENGQKYGSDGDKFCKFILKQTVSDASNQVVLFNGGDQQSSFLEQKSAEQETGFSFLAYQHLTDSLNETQNIYKLNPYLIPDTLFYRPFGETLAKMNADAYLDTRGNLLDHDRVEQVKKFSLLKAQIHLFASENPGARHFKYFSSDLRLLETLAHCFADAKLIPAGLDLQLFVVDLARKKDLAKEIQSIKGTGVINQKWEDELRASHHWPLPSTTERSEPKPQNYFHAEVAKNIATADLNIYKNNWVREKILNPIDSQINELKTAEQSQLCKDKIKIFEDARLQISNLILKNEPTTIPKLHQEITSVLADFAKPKTNSVLNSSREKVKHFFWGLLGAALSFGGILYLSSSYRNTFWNTKSQVLTQNLIETANVKQAGFSLS